MKASKQNPNKNIKGYVFQTQRWSLHDGDGIRTSIFLGGCPLRCSWCHNPESWSRNSTETVSVEEVIKTIKRDEVFYRASGGGVTFSGGEPTYQTEFLRGLVKSCMLLGINTAIETSGFFNWKSNKDIFQMLDFVFVDIKHMDSKIHKKYTGVGNKLILENITKISDLGKTIIIRIPLILGVNDDDENIDKTSRFILENLDIEGVEILPYHNLGEYKYKELGLDTQYQFAEPAKERIEEIKDRIKSHSINIIDY
ncbi:pyruvate formate lyase activating enzyme [Anaerovirgula multivorans]|uniref:Pyruvate formate lyase activating enzyme n=1 Tax=Anaerovirgula multivorans TaxID=312168 RepID=A0A239JMX2_9FIRM|nr:glycyl-radical enzyme activating protein [Anaerovirgula multivorans]SNT07150.1 pyruvate formate lyase activating enzyme [Anaerovirgula multivorans]